jgi:hypothetical protein
VESVESVSAHVIRDSVEVELRGFVVVEISTAVGIRVVDQGCEMAFEYIRIAGEKRKDSPRVGSGR